MQRNPPSGELYFEWCSGLSRHGVMLPLSAMPNVLKKKDTGYRSVYLFAEPDALAIKASGSSRGFNKYEVYSNEVFIDLDGGESQLEKAHSALAGLEYSVWSSGGKGYHVVLETEMLLGIDVPEAHKQWVDSLHIDADLSLYRASSIISLPGRVHPRTKKKKSFVEFREGRRLEIPDPKPVSEKFSNLQADVPDLAWALMRAADLAATQPRLGNRHISLWSLAGAFAELGFTETFTVELLTEVNNRWEAQKSQEELERAVKQAYRRQT